MRVSALLAVLLLAASADAREPEGVPIGTGTKPAKVVISAPAGGWSVGRMMLVEGEVSDPTIDPIVLSINGDRYLLRTQNGRFSRKFPAATGRNVVTVRATNKGGTTNAQVTTYAQIPTVPLKVVLTSDTDGVYTDLHVYEPTAKTAGAETLTVGDTAHVYWANTESPSGGTFFLNEQGGSFDQPGYGPYLYVHRAPPKGVFVIAANYWPSGDKAHTVGTLNLSLFEGTARETKRMVNVPLATPGTTKVLAFVNVVDADRASVYVPGQDPVPTGAGWPKNLAEVEKTIQKGGND